MGTTPGNFPPNPLMAVGETQVGNLLAQASGFASTVFFTAPVAGLYQLAITAHVTANGTAGTAAVTLTTPSGGTTGTLFTQTMGASAVDGNAIVGAQWMNAGDQAKITATVGTTFAGGATYNMFLAATRLF